jgi:hypothetical protein
VDDLTIEDYADLTGKHTVHTSAASRWVTSTAASTT